MGLCIKGKKTGLALNGSYSRLHNGPRYLVLLYCGMPEILGTKKWSLKNEYKDIDSFLFFMNPHGFEEELNFEKDKLLSFHWALQCSGLYFPNIMMHSDNNGSYTKNGKIDLENNSKLTKGNSIKLLKELDKLCNEKKFINSDNERIISALEWTKKIKNLVKEEIENGCGTIIFQ